jgi:hypothetical protein
VNACTNLTEIENIKEILVPQMMGGTSSEFVASVSFGNPVDASLLRCQQQPSPRSCASQGDTIQMCVRLSTNSSYYLEDIYMMAPSLSLPQASWLTTLYQTAMHRHQPPRIASWACAISEVKFPVASLTKIQIEILIPRIVGVALLNLFR